MPISHWDVVYAQGMYVPASYGSFVANGGFSTDTTTFGISTLEAQMMDPQLSLVMEASFAALHDTTVESAR